MASGNKIVVTPYPKGVFLEGRIRGPESPGIMVQIDVSESAISGRFQWEPYDQAVDAQMGLVAILLEDELQGKVNSAAYVDGDRCFMYCPIPGEEMNIMLQDLSGTGDDHSLGDRVIVDDGTGKFIATTGTAADKSEPFILLEAVVDPNVEGSAPGVLTHAMFTGY